MAGRSFGLVMAKIRYVCEGRARLSRVVERTARPAGNINLINLRHQRQGEPCSCVVGTIGGAARSTSTRATSRREPRAARPPNPRRLLPDPGTTGGDDEYRWMHDINSDELLGHIERENRYSSAYLRPLHRRASELFRCMMERQPEEEGGDRRSVPERLGSYLYYTRRDDGKGFPVYVRRPVEGTVDDERVVFDLNEIEENGLRAGCGGHGGREEQQGQEKDDFEQEAPTPALGSMKLSSDQRMLACTIDLDGSDRFVLAVFDLLGGGGETTQACGSGSPQQGAGEAAQACGSGSPQQGPPTPVTVLREDAMWDDVVGVEWGSSWPSTTPGSGGGGIQDCRSYELYYTAPDDLRRPWQVRRVTLHRDTATAASPDLGVESGGGGGATGRGWRVDSASDRAVFEEENDAFFVDVGKTKDHGFVVINVHSKTTSEVYVIAAADDSADGGSGDGGAPGSVSVSAGAGAGAGPTLLRRRRQGVEYYVDHAGDAFYLVTNSPPSVDDVDGARGGWSGAATATRAGEYHLVRVRHPPGLAGSLEGIADMPWQPVPHGGDGGGTVQEMDLFKDHCVLYESCPGTGCPRLRVLPLTPPAAAEGTRSSSSSVSSPFVVSPPAVGGCGGDDGTGASGSSSARGADTGNGSDVNVVNSRAAVIGEAGVEAGAAAAAAGAPARACTLRPGVNSWFEARTARFSLSSPTAPEDVYDLCLESGRMDLRRRTEVPGTPRFNGRGYSCYTTQVASRHGETVPLTIVHRRGARLDGSNRLLLHGYGAYGMSLPIDYHPSHACMLERGWVLAFAHVRGGGERGKAWHAAGRGLNKWNSFWDFEACAEYLVSEGFTSPSSMGAHVNSAGGLLGGVMANVRPGLFSAMVMKAPFLGVLSAMRDSSLPLTVHEFDEWGDPNSSEEVEAVIRSYCPYENVREHEYPALLVSASVNDNRVNVWDPAKWVSRVRAANTGDSPVLLRVSDSDGHHGPGNTLDGLKDSALEMAFLEEHLKACDGS